MKFFAALRAATFAEKLFAAAGLDFAAMLATNDEKALAAALAAAKSPAKNDEAETALALATKENDELSTRIASVEANHAALSTALATAGVEINGAVMTDGLVDGGKLKNALDAKTTKAARDMVARAGHPGILDELVVDPAKHEKVNDKPKTEAATRTGRERVAFALNKEFAAASVTSRSRRN